MPLTANEISDKSALIFAGYVMNQMCTSLDGV